MAETALRKSGPLAVPVLIEAFGEEANVTRVKAARILGCLGDLAAEAIPALTTALQDSDSNIRLAAAKALWNIQKAEVVVPVLVHLLHKTQTADFEDGECRRRFLQTVIEALSRIGPPAKTAVPALIDLMKDKNRLVSESDSHRRMRRIAPATMNEPVHHVNEIAHAYVAYHDLAERSVDTFKNCQTVTSQQNTSAGRRWTFHRMVDSWPSVEIPDRLFCATSDYRKHLALNTDRGRYSSPNACTETSHTDIDPVDASVAVLGGHLDSSQQCHCG